MIPPSFRENYVQILFGDITNFIKPYGFPPQILLKKHPSLDASLLMFCRQNWS